MLLTLYITFASCQLYWLFKEAEIQAIELTLDATKKEERESKSEREKENAGQEDLEFERGKTMHYEFEKLRVTPVSGEMREWECYLFIYFLFFFLVSVWYVFTGWNSQILPVQPVFFSSTKQRGYLYRFAGRYNMKLTSLPFAPPCNLLFNYIYQLV